MNYLPEWKIYLWKKLLLMKDSSGKKTLKDFLFFDEDERRKLIVDEIQSGIDASNYTFKLAVARGEPLTADDFPLVGVTEPYYDFRSERVLGALIELVAADPKILEIGKIKYTKGKAKNLKLEDLTKLAQSEDTLSSEHLSFEINLNKPALEEKLLQYLEDFQADNLIMEIKNQYGYQKQRAIFLDTLEVIAKKFEQKKFSMGFDDIAKKNNWILTKPEQRFRFFEMMFSLEKEGVFSIIELTKNKVLISLKKEDPNKPRYFVKFDPKSRKVTLNEQYLLSKPDFLGTNHKFIEYMTSRPNENITKNELEKQLGELRSFQAILSDLGFKGELKTLFFNNASSEGIFFRNPVTRDDLTSLGIDEEKLNEIIKGLETVGNSRK